ncbi:MAG: hypothetical protein AB1679_01355 [Actinomycetota bacterium]
MPTLVKRCSLMEEIMDMPIDPKASGRRQVLVVGPDLYLSWMISDVLSDHHYEVALCPGPEFIPAGCPLIQGRGCALVERSDILLTGLDSDQPLNRMVARTLRTVHPGKPMITFSEERRTASS